MSATLSLRTDRYRLGRVLGRGGMATVYAARDQELDRPVAVKLLHDHLAVDPHARARVLREARVAAGIVHPNVVAVYDLGEDEEGRPFIVMEQVEGETLGDKLRREGRIAHSEAVALLLQACAGVGHAHACGLVHRDVKPGNLLLRRDGTVKVADFGIARAADGTALTEVGTILGTAAYLAPEQARGERATPATDVYALGVVLYELIAGHTPYRFETVGELGALDDLAPPKPLRELDPGVPPALEEAVMRALARDPAYRPQSADDLGRELSGDRTAATLPLPLRAPSRRRRRLLLGAGATGAAVAAAATLGLTLARGGSSQPQPARVTPVPNATTPVQQAENLARWIHAHSR
jgi:serine/threonine protein kinase